MSIFIHFFSLFFLFLKDTLSDLSDLSDLFIRPLDSVSVIMTMSRRRKRGWVWKDGDLQDLIAGRDYLCLHSRNMDGPVKIPENWKQLFYECDAARKSI